MPGKDASVKCFDAALGKVYLPCLRFIVVRNGPVSYFGIHSLFLFVACFLRFCIVYLAIRKRTPRGSRRFRQARRPLPAARDGIANPARCCPPRPSRRFAIRARSSKLPRHHFLFAPTRCGRPYCPYFLLVLLTTASSQTTTGTTRTTCSSQCTTSTPMTTLISTIAWCTSCVERAH